MYCQGFLVGSTKWIKMLTIMVGRRGKTFKSQWLKCYTKILKNVKFRWWKIIRNGIYFESILYFQNFQSLWPILQFILHLGLLRNRSTPWQKFFFRKMLFSFIRFILLMLGWTKNRYFTSNLWMGNPLGAFKDIQILAQSVGRTHHKIFWSY